MSRSSGLMDLWKFVFCFLIDVWINSKVYLNVSELILKYLQILSSSLSKSSRRLWNSPELSRLELILCTQKRLFLVNKRLLQQILSINENTCTWFDILAVQVCQLHGFQFQSARLAMWIVNRSARFSSVRSGSARLGSARLAVWMSPNGSTAFPVTCTILGPRQLLGKIQKETLFRKFGSTGRKVLSL
jgi:hypothetical protein